MCKVLLAAEGLYNVVMCKVLLAAEVQYSVDMCNVQLPRWSDAS
jgi:hypothetical protein